MKRIVIIVMLLAATAARAFDFKLAAPTGQEVYYTVVAGTSTVKVVSPNWDVYTQPTGLLELPTTVEHDGTTYAVKSIDAEAFAYCTELTGIVIPEGVTSIGRMAFFYCTALDSIVLPSTLEVLGTQAFNTTAYLNDNSRWTDGMLIIGTYLIKTRASVHDSVGVPEGITGLGNMAVYNCTLITNITLPSTLRFIGENAFNSCSALDTVTVLATVPPSLDVNSFLNVSDFTVFVPCGSRAAYDAAPNWSTLTLVEMCDPVGIAEVEQVPQLAATSVAGGIVVSGTQGQHCTVRDLLGRPVATVDGDNTFIPLTAHGIYLVSSAEGKTIKVVFNN